MSRRLVFAVTDEITATSFLRGYLGHLVRAGWDVTVIASSRGGLEELATHEGVHARPVPMRREPAPRADARSLLLMRAALKAARPDVVVAATPKAGLLAMLAARSLRVPSRVYHVWGLRLETARGPMRRLLLALERLAARSATLVVANSNSLAEELAAHGIIDHALVPGDGSSHGVDTTRFSPDAELPAPPVELIARLAEAEPGTLVIGCIGRVHRDKGIDAVLDAVETITTPALLVVVGPNEDDELERKLHASPRVLRIPHVDDPRPLFAVLDVHVLATHREGFPNVVLEASAMAIPTITTTATGARDSVIDGETGWIVPIDDVAAIAAALTEAADPALRERLGAAARQHVVERFEQAHVWQEQERVLAEHDARRRVSV